MTEIPFLSSKAITTFYHIAAYCSKYERPERIWVNVPAYEDAKSLESIGLVSVVASLLNDPLLAAEWFELTEFGWKADKILSEDNNRLYRELGVPNIYF